MRLSCIAQTAVEYGGDMTGIRIQKLKERFEDLKIDGILIANPFNRLYLSDFTGTSGYLLIGKNKSIIITDFRYIEQAHNQCTGYEIIDQGKDFYKTLFKAIQDTNIRNLGIEENHITLRQFGEYEKKLSSIKLVPVRGEIKKFREIKDIMEISKIRKAAEITDNAFEHILKYIRPGITEKEIAIELEYFMKKQGASAVSFETIVASGERSSMPHGAASLKKIEYKDTVTLDFGCIYEGYCSDMTRTVFVGEAKKEMNDIYRIVLEAQQAALQVLKPGLLCKDVDACAREIISRYGYGENFGHGLGHSVGLEVHEEPAVSSKSERILEPGMVVTIEPGIYLEGVGGVRIEDLVLITESGYENFVKVSKKLTIVN